MTPQGNILISGGATSPFVDPTGYRAGVAEREQAPLPESRKNPSEDFRTHGVKMAFDLRITPTEDFAFVSDNAGNAIELIEHKTR